MKRLVYIWITVLVFVSSGYSDGLLVPEDEEYPKDFLRNCVTNVTVNIHGLIAETSVYQEFENEWTEKTDAVYSFPLPPDARATNFLYWRNDTTFKAILKVKEQAVNPGTGQGGIIALVNDYIGRNGIKIKLLGIEPGTIQKVQLNYISQCKYNHGKVTYQFPLETKDFVTHPINHLQFNISVESNSSIIAYDIPSHQGFSIAKADSHSLELNLSQPKAYLDQNFIFEYETENKKLGVDFYSTANKSMDGHYVLYVRPPDSAEPDSVLPSRIIFLLDTSSRMFGNKLENSITAVKKGLELLKPSDSFNIIKFNSYYSNWQNLPVPANQENISAALSYLNTIGTGSGSDLQSALTEAFAQIQDNNYNNAILLFSNGYSTVDPKTVSAANNFNIGIFPIAMEPDIDRPRLEMLANLNYGYVTYISQDGNLLQNIQNIITQLCYPILKDVVFEFGLGHVYGILPKTIPTTYAGSCFFITGRYKNPGTSAFAMAGKSVNGDSFYNFLLDYSLETNTNKFAEHIWAKEMMDVLEREIEIYGETISKKDSLIDLSLKYNIRCRYTAYIADYKNIYTNIEYSVGPEPALPDCYILGNYPNPFNPTTTIEFVLGTNTLAGTEKIYSYFQLIRSTGRYYRH